MIPQQTPKPSLNKEYFNQSYFIGQTSSNYKFYSDHPFNKSLINYLLKHKKSGTLLEIGCAFGYFLKYASEHFKTYGMDISKFAINKAKNITPKSKLKVGNVEKDLKKFIGNNKFDVIVALDILEHLEKPEETIKLIYNSLKENGIFIFRVPNKSCPDYIFYKLIRKSEKWHGNKDKTHISLYSLKKWKNLAEKYGFEVKSLPYIPLKFVKNFVIKYIPQIFFVPRIFYFTNTSLTFVCWK